MGLHSRFYEDEAAFDEFIDVLLGNTADNLTTPPKGFYAQLKVTQNPTDTGVTVDGVSDYLTPKRQLNTCLCQTTIHVSIWCFLQTTAKMMPKMGYHGLRASDL